MRYIKFELSMPCRGSWDNKYSNENKHNYLLDNALKRTYSSKIYNEIYKDFNQYGKDDYLGLEPQILLKLF